MWSVRLPMICRRKHMNRTTHLRCFFNPISVNHSVHDTGKRYISHSIDSSQKSTKNGTNTTIDKMSLASNLASLVEETSLLHEKKPRTRLELKRFLESRIKKTVKEQFKDGKFHNLIEKVIANPYTLQDAYDSIRVNSNITLLSQSDSINFDSLAQELSSGTFNINANTYSLSTKQKQKQKQKLILPNLELSIIQEAIRIALEVVYKPHYSKISHGCRSGRGHLSALKYIRKEISKSNYWFTVIPNKKLDDFTLSKLISTMETKIQDPKLYSLICTMFDSGVLNVEFGGFAKGHGLPQEGLLSPILMNIYLDHFDREILNLSMKYEALDGQRDESKSKSKLRDWFRRQMSQNSQQNKSEEVRVHCCRLMDEILVVVKGSKEVSLTLKSEIENFMREFLHLEFDNKTDVFPCSDPRGVRFSGNIVIKSMKESPAVKAVHKLKEKVELFALQKQEAWDECMVRIGKKCLGHGLKKVKESEIKHLADCTSVLSQVSRFRKPGMETDHWYKVLLKIRMQEMNSKHESEESILSKLITENALPHDLKDSFHTFQNHVKDYVSSETNSILTLVPESESESESVSVTEVLAPIKAIKMCLQRYGITNSDGIPRACSMILLLDHDHIIDWFSGLVSRWIKWYRVCDNFNEVKLIISQQIRKSCIRTLATKYRLHESEIEWKFDSDLNGIPITEEFESEELECDVGCCDEGLMYGILNSGLCLVSLVRIVSESRPCICFVMGCRVDAPCVYRIHVMQKQKFPILKTGFSSCIHPSVNGRRIGLCKEHLRDLFSGRISLQSVSFGAWK